MQYNMWASLYNGLSEPSRVYWYLCFSEEKGQLENDLNHALEAYRDIRKYWTDDAILTRTVEDIITVFSKRVEEWKTHREMGNPIPELGGEDCKYRAMLSLSPI